MYEDTPDDFVHDLLARASFGDHPLGYPILGTEENLNMFNKEILRTYIDELYTPENIVISIAGNVDESFMPVVEKYFNQFDASVAPKTQKITRPKFLANKIQKDKDTEQAHLCLGFNGLKLGDDITYSLIIMNNVLGGSMSSRLFQDVREKNGLAYSVFSYHSSFLDNGLLTIYAGTGKEQLPLLQDTINKTVEQLIESGLTEKELINSKEQSKGNVMLSLESTNSRMSRNGRNELLLNRHRTLDDMIHEIDAVNHESIQQMISRIFRQSPSSALIAPTVTN